MIIYQNYSKSPNIIRWYKTFEYNFVINTTSSLSDRNKILEVTNV